MTMLAMKIGNSRWFVMAFLKLNHNDTTMAWNRFTESSNRWCFISTRLSLENYSIWKVKLDIRKHSNSFYIQRLYLALCWSQYMATEQQHSLLVERLFVGCCRCQYMALQLRHLVQLLCFCFWDWTRGPAKSLRNTLLQEVYSEEVCWQEEDEM